MTTSAPDRLLNALRGVNEALNSDAAYAPQWEYRVLTASPGPPTKIDCEAVDPITQANLPTQLVGLLLWPGPSGIVAVPQPGTLVRVAFVNGDPAKPAVVGLDPNGTPLLVMGFVETTMQLGDQSAQPLAKAAALATLNAAAGVYAAAVAAALSLAGFPVAGALATYQQALTTASTTTPTTKVLGS